MLSKPIYLSETEDSGISCVRVNLEIYEGTPKAKATLWVLTDAQMQKPGERIGLDTLVFHAINDECSPLVYANQLVRLTNKIERAFLACLVKSSFWTYLASDDEVELTAEKDSIVRRATRCCGLPVKYWRKLGMTLSPHGPYRLGHTHATMAFTMGSNAVRWSKSRKIASVQIILCNSRT
ncbi:hypothetical protein H5410_028056 [Solanum commersonii]|uniref:Uncharacterized protein n=1 Tax=Solanum commersonii TaxID=4109 RepID=A0A9J5Z553_SOLCO|nr:hypothetical protein H5410_028056 [Solanum commersonii]